MRIRTALIIAGHTGLSAELTGVNAEFTGMNAEFTGVNTEFTGVNAEFTGVNAELTGVNAELTHVNAVFLRAYAVRRGSGERDRPVRGDMEGEPYAPRPLAGIVPASGGGGIRTRE